MTSKTTVLKGDSVIRRWHLIDLQGQTLGRSCTKIAEILTGKNKPTFSYHRDDGDYVVVINASLVTVTGKKKNDKLYHHYSGFAGGLKTQSFSEMMARDPREVIIHGVAGMIPKNKLRDKRLSRLKVFSGSEHPYSDKLNQK